MKLSSLSLATALTVLVCSASPLAAQTSPSTTRVDLASSVHLASIDTTDHALRRYAGQNLVNSEGAVLGEVRDFLVAPASSRIPFVVVSSGGVLGGMGNSLRLVPLSSLRYDPQQRVFVLDILQSQWLQLPPLSDREYAGNRFTMTRAQHDAMVQQLRSTNGNSSAAADRTNRIPAYNEEFTGLVRANSFRGRDVHAGGVKVGEIENVILDVERGTIAALLDASGDFTGTTAKYLVPINRLTFGATARDPITTTLTRADFDRARPSNYGVTPNTPPAAASTEPALQPTGRDTRR